MKVAIVTSVSSKIASYASLTTPNKAEYCLRHGYSLVVDDCPYDEFIAGIAWWRTLLDRYELLWSLDADAVITNMSVPIHTLDCLGPHVTACEEGIVGWNRVNCGSVVWKNTPECRGVLEEITANPSAWKSLPCGWQTWIADRPELTVAPLRAFNSCVWNRPAGGEYMPGSHWQPGDFVCHPCGVFPQSARVETVRWALGQVSA